MNIKKYNKTKSCLLHTRSRSTLQYCVNRCLLNPVKSSKYTSRSTAFTRGWCQWQHYGHKINSDAQTLLLLFSILQKQLTTKKNVFWEVVSLFQTLGFSMSHWFSVENSSWTKAIPCTKLGEKITYLLIFIKQFSSSKAHCYMLDRLYKWIFLLNKYQS